MISKKNILQFVIQKHFNDVESRKYLSLSLCAAIRWYSIIYDGEKDNIKKGDAVKMCILLQMIEEIAKCEFNPLQFEQSEDVMLSLLAAVRWYGQCKDFETYNVKDVDRQNLITLVQLHEYFLHYKNYGNG